MDINIKILFPEGGNAMDIRTKKLTLDEREDPTLDFIGGLQMIDSQHRLFILEGLTGEGNSISLLKEYFPKTEQNDGAFKVIRNEKMTFAKRLYVDFECDLKRIKLYKTIHRLTLTNEVYNRKLCPIETYNTIMKIRRIKEKWILQEIDDSGLWLTQEELLTFERNYGDALNEYDLYGKETIKMKKKQKGSTSTHNASTLSGNSNLSENKNILTEKTQTLTLDYIRESMGCREDSDAASSKERLPEKSLDVKTIGSERTLKVDFVRNDVQKENSIGSPSKISRHTDQLPTILKTSKSHQNNVLISDRRAASSEKFGLGRDTRHTEMTRATSEQNLARIRKNRFAMVPLVNPELKKKSRKYEEYKHHLLDVKTENDKNLMKSIMSDLKAGENAYMAQTRMLRQQACNDKNHFYTYSKDYLGASIDPFNAKEVTMSENEIRQKKFITKSGFENIMKRENSHQHKLSLHDSKIYDLQNEPYHIAKEEAMQFKVLKKDHDGIEGCSLFRTILPPLKHENINFNGQEKMTAQEKIAIEKQFKDDEKEKFRKKLIVDDPAFHVNTKLKSNKSVSHIDKYKGLLNEKDPVKKKGLMISKKYLDKSKLPMDSVFKPLPISYNTHEDKIPGVNKNRQGSFKKFNMNRCVSNTDFWNYTNYPESKNYVFKQRRLDDFK